MFFWTRMVENKSIGSGDAVNVRLDTDVERLSIKSDTPSKTNRSPSLSIAPFPPTLEKDDAAIFPTITSSTANPEDYPEGGPIAWRVVFGVFCTMFTTFGYVNAWGVFQSFYQDDLLRHEDPSAVSWIGSLQYCLIFFTALFSGRLFDLGWTYTPIIAAEVVFVASNLTIPHCKTLWQFIIVQGLLNGTAIGFLFGPAPLFISHWFRAKRGLAMSIAATGGSVGGTVLPIMVKSLLPRIGFPWTMRAVALLMVCVSSMSHLCVRRRLPPTYPRGGLFNLKSFKSPVYAIYTASAFFAFLGMYTLLTFIDVSAVDQGVDPGFSFYLVAIVNASTAWGRLSLGVVADKFGSVNTLIPVSLSIAIFSYAWPYCHTKAAFIVLAVFYGAGLGSYTTIYSQPTIQFGEMSDAGRRVVSNSGLSIPITSVLKAPPKGMLFTISGLGCLIGPPISGAIYDKVGGFKEVSYFSGTSMIIAAGLLLGAKWAERGSLSFRDKL